MGKGRTTRLNIILCFVIPVACIMQNPLDRAGRLEAWNFYPFPPLGPRCLSYIGQIISILNSQVHGYGFESKSIDVKVLV